MARYLAIDVDANGLYVAAGSVHRGKFALEKVAFAPTDGHGLSPGTAPALGRQLKDLLKQAGVAPAPVLMCLGRDKVILKDVTHPPTSGPEEPIVVKFQAVKDLTNDAEEMELDYLPTGETTDGQRTALAVFARKDAVKAAKAFCEAAGLKMHALTPRPFAATAAAQAAVAAGAAEPTDDPADPVAVLTLTDNGGEFTAAKAGRVLFSRAVPAPAVQSEAALVGEVRRNLAVFAGQGGGDPARAVYVAEGGPPEGGWTYRLAAGLSPVPVHRFDPLAGVSLGEEIPDHSRGRFAGVVGLLSLATAASLPINYITPRQPKAEVNRSRIRWIAAGVAAAFLLVAGGVAGYLALEAKNEKLAALTEQNKTLDQEIKASEENENRLKAADEFLAYGIPIHDELYELSHKFPNIDRMKLTQFEFTSKKMPTEKERERLEKERKAKATGGSRRAVETIPPPTGEIKLTVSTADVTLVDTLVKSLVADGKYGANPGYYLGTVKKATTSSASGQNNNNRSQYLITTNVSPRKPADYRGKLTATAPVAPDPGPDVDFDGGPIGGMPVTAGQNRGGN